MSDNCHSSEALSSKTWDYQVLQRHSYPELRVKWLMLEDELKQARRLKKKKRLGKKPKPKVKAWLGKIDT